MNEEEQLAYNKDEAMQDLSEVDHLVILVDNNTIVGMFVFDEISSIECVQIEEISKGIYAIGGKIKCGSTKGFDKMVMCSWRCDMQKKRDDIDAFGRFT